MEKPKKVKNKLEPITLLNVAEREDGGAAMEFEVNPAFLKRVKAFTGKKRVSKEDVNNFILMLLQDSPQEVLKKNAK